MTLLNRYLCREIIKAILGASLAMMGVIVFILFVNEMDAIGSGDYGIAQAFYFVLLQIPQLLYQFFPMIALMGSLFALGELASHHELTVMRASGLSILQLVVCVLQAALFLTLIVSVLGETVVPRLTHHAVLYKEAHRAKHRDADQAGIWTRIGSDFIYIQSIESRSVLKGIEIFRIENNNCVRATRAKRAVLEDGNWRLEEVKTTDNQGSQVKVSESKILPWPIELDTRLLDASRFTPNEMTVGVLHRLIQVQTRNHVASGQYELAYWERLLQPASSAVMMLLAIPFVFGSLRSTSMGARLVMGVVVGFSFYMMNRFFGPVSLVFQLPPFWAALLPTLFFASIALFLVMRFRI